MKKYGFTLSEVLITLGIIGIVASITLPSLINKINDIQYDRAREIALNSVGEAGRLLAIQGDIASATNTEDFVKNYLSKKFKIAKYCGRDFQSCGLSQNITKVLNTEKIDMPATINSLSVANKGGGSKAPAVLAKNNPSYGILSANGYSMNIFYTPNCSIDNKLSGHYSQNMVCLNVIYDMNGIKGPNKAGKDIGFVSILYPDETVRAVAPKIVKLGNSNDWNNANKACIEKNLTLPDRDELASIIYNAELIGLKPSIHYYWSSTSGSNKRAWRGYTNYDDYSRNIISIQNTLGVICIQR